MNNSHLRDIIAKGLPKIAATAVATYPLGFQHCMETSRDQVLDTPFASSQLAYTKKSQILSFLVLDPAQIVKLGQRVFPKYGRLESTRMVLSANGEILNSITSRLGYLIGRLDDEIDVSVAPPLILNCSGADRVPVRGQDSLFMRFTAQDVSMLFVTSIHAV